MPHIELLLLYEFLYLHFDHFHTAIFLLPVVTTEVFVAPSVQVEHNFMQ